MRLTAAEVYCLLECMQRVYGMGYAEGDAGKLQAKLSIMLEAKAKCGDSSLKDNQIEVPV